MTLLTELRALQSRLFPNRYIKAVIGILNEANLIFDHAAFQIVRNEIEKVIYAHPEELVTILKTEGVSARACAYSMIANIAAEQVTSGHYHVYAGILNPMKGGQHLLNIFEQSTNELVQLKYLSNEEAEKNRKFVHERIRIMG